MQKTDNRSVRKPAANWMGPHEIMEGEYLSLTKAQLETWQLPYQPVKAQVYSTGLLATAGYQGELAKDMAHNKEILLTSGGIARKLFKIAVSYYRAAGVPEAELAKTKKGSKEPALQHTKDTIRKTLASLEDDGRAERRVNGKPLRGLAPTEARKLAGNARATIELYFFLKPRAHNRENVAQEWQDWKNQTPKSFPQVVQNGLLHPSIQQILKLYNFDVSLISAIQSVQNHEAIITEAWNAGKEKFLEVVRHGLHDVVLPDPLEVVPGGGAFERNVERNVEIEKTPPPPSSNGKRTTKQEEEEALFNQLRAQYPAGRFDEGPTRRRFEAIPKAKREMLIACLGEYLTCQRWVRSLEDDGGRFIPLSSNWIQSFEAAPPPYIPPAAKKGLASEDEVLRALEDRRKGVA